MAKHIFLFVFLSCIFNSFSQSKSLTSNRKPGHPYFGHGIEKEIKNYNDIPSFIKTNTSAYIKRYFGINADSISFSHGQIVDLKKLYNRKDLNKTHKRQWLVSEYDLTFKLVNRQKGIEYHYFQIKLDKYGQLLKIDWTLDKDPNKILSLNNALELAKEHAKSENIDYTMIIPKLKFDENNNSVYWLLIFELDNEKNKKTNWNSDNYNKDTYEIKINIKSNRFSKVMGEYSGRVKNTVY